MIKKRISSGKRTLPQRTRKTVLQMLAACGFLIGAGMMQSCNKDDLILTGQPSWLGNSIYERLQEGIDLTDGTHATFQYTLNLINDLTEAEPDYDYVNILSTTGSRTLFVAPDEAYDAYFASKGISYSDLTVGQKKELFNGSIITNAYVLNLMSNTEGNPPTEGACMRRTTAASNNDNVPVMQPSEFPYNDENSSDNVNHAWSAVRAAGQPISIYEDVTDAPMIHFLPRFMQKNNITDEDLQIISNGKSQSIDDSWINGKKVISEGQTCKNGYIYVVDDVMADNMNMAKIIHSKPELSIWASMLDRWAVPAKTNSSEIINRIYNSSVGTYYLTAPYTLAYANNSANGGLMSYVVSEGDTVKYDGASVLPYDPGWNQYTASGNDMASDAGAMFVPCDSAFNAWYDKGAGNSLKQYYGSYKNIPLTLLVQLFKVTMQDQFVTSVPSKFSSIMDGDRKVGGGDGIQKSDIKACYMGCNGVVYVTNRVFTPSAYSSVMYPTNLFGGTGAVFSTIYHAMKASYNDAKYDATEDLQKAKLNVDFTPYLNAMDSKLTLIAPYNNCVSKQDPTKSVIRYLDPTSYGLSKQRMMEFFFDDDNQMKAYVYDCTLNPDNTINEGSITLATIDGKNQAKTPLLCDNSSSIINNMIVNRMNDYIDNSILVEMAKQSSDKQYYVTKAGSAIRVFNNGGGVGIQGGYQMETNQVINVDSKHTFDMDNGGGNGITYGVNDGTGSNYIDIPLTATKSVWQFLGSNSDHIFYDLINDDVSNVDAQYESGATPSGVTSVLTTSTQAGTGYYPAGGTSNKNMSIFDNYNYTIYVPTDDVLSTLITNGILPTWQDFSDASTDAEKVFIANRIHEFIRYHIHDNSVFVNGGANSLIEYETALLDSNSKRFYTLKVTTGGNGLSVKDGAGDTRNVLTSDCNHPARELWIDGDPSKYNCLIKASSNAIIHKIDGALFETASKRDTKWKTAFITSSRAKRSFFKK